MEINLLTDVLLLLQITYHRNICYSNEPFHKGK